MAILLNLVKSSHAIHYLPHAVLRFHSCFSCKHTPLSFTLVLSLCVGPICNSKCFRSAIVALHQKGNISHDVIDTVLVPQGFVSMAYEASKMGKLSVLRADLPLHYLASAEVGV